MNRDWKEIVIIVLVAAVVIAVVVSAVFAYSGLNRPLTVVESNSMQHSDDTSYLGIIDTGDMVIMVSPDKTDVTTFIEGTQNGYWKFGSYGDVIIYYRVAKNPVIHRAILWLDYDETASKWSAPSLKDCSKDYWYNEGTWDDLKGVLVIKNLPYKDGYVDTSINLDDLAQHSGYLTKGDNNGYFDQMTTIHTDAVQRSELKAVAGEEIPWLGCIKLLVKDKNTNMIPKNSIPCLFVFFIDVIAFIALISMLLDYRHRLKEPYEE